VNDPGPIRIEGRSTSGPGYRFDQGFVTFPGSGPVQVPLGELRTDDAGRLLVLGGDGRSGSATNQPAVTFANNDGWYDDTSDGPVRARVKLKGSKKAMDAEPAMVAVTPPNFGPGLFGVVTLYDVVYDLFLRHGWIKGPKRLTFWGHVFPIFERMVDSQWVNQGAYILFGPGSPGDLTAPDLLPKLADPGAGSRRERERVFRLFRQPPAPWDDPGRRAKLPPPQPSHQPPFYGDGFGEYEDIAIDELALTQTQYEWLRLWAEGKFIPGERPPRSFDEIPLAEQPSALDRTPLEDCLGGPFHPGIELTWPMRRPSLWRKPQDANGLPFRLNILPPDQAPQDDFGAVLTPEVCLGPGGPLDASGPGTLTRWLGIPWQTDEASCLAGYDTSSYLPVPSFWAARVPNFVLSQQAFDQATEPRLSYPQRFKQLAYRQFWLRDIQGSGYQARINNMVKEWHLLGIVVEQAVEHPGDLPVEPEPGFPARYWVETDHPHGEGWHVDRRRFEARLAEAAREAGAEWRWGCRVERIGDVEADFVADATGRSARLARRLGARRLRYDRLVGVCALLSSRTPATDTYTLVEATPEGWWYSALLADGRLAVAFLGDGDLLHPSADPAPWWRRLRESEATRERVESHGYEAGPLRVLPAESSRLDVIAGDGWLALGDAAAAYDPLSSYGIASAMGSGFYGGHAIADLLAGREEARFAYLEIMQRACGTCLDLQREHYARERRWPDALFWRRRQAPEYGLEPQGN